MSGSTDRPIDVTADGPFEPSAPFSTPITVPITASALIVLEMGVTGVRHAVAVSFVRSATTTGAWFSRGTRTDDSLSPSTGDYRD